MCFLVIKYQLQNRCPWKENRHTEKTVIIFFNASIHKSPPLMFGYIFVQTFFCVYVKCS